MGTKSEAQTGELESRLSCLFRFWKDSSLKKERRLADRLLQSTETTAYGPLSDSGGRWRSDLS